MSEVWIVQPYVPGYRVPFFEGLSNELRQYGVSVRVVGGQPDSTQAQRGDATSPPWLTTVRSSGIRLLGRSLTLTRTRALWNEADAVIVPLMGSSLDALSALSRKRGLKVGVWGHVGSYTSRANFVDERIERWQMERAERLFAYTPGGSRVAQERGISPDKITVVMNSVDTSILTQTRSHFTDSDAEQFRADYQIPANSPLALFIGGIDTSKRIDLLAGALDELHRRNSPLHVLVVGSGGQAGVLDQAARRGQVTMAGRLLGAEKAKAFASCSIVANPGRIGLVAVEALAAGKPIITTTYAFHAPEAEYLDEGVTRFSCEEDPVAYANLLETHSHTYPRSRSELTVNVRPYPTLESMISNYSRGVRELMAS